MIDEMATDENAQIVSAIYNAGLAAEDERRALSADLQVICDVEHMMQEVNSGASYEQYFRWASIEELQRIEKNLAMLGLTRVLALTREAVQVAFPTRLPDNFEDKSASADGWTADQQEKLSKLFEELERWNGHVLNVLGRYAKSVNAAQE